MLKKLNNNFYKFLSYLAISNYISLNSFNSKNNFKIPLIFKIFQYLSLKKIFFFINKKRKQVGLQKDFLILLRKRKILVIDHIGKLAIHSFFSPIKKVYYELARNNFEQQFNNKNISFPRYSCRQHLGGILVVIEDKVSGVALSDCEQSVIDKFLYTYLNDIKNKIENDQNSNNSSDIYNVLHVAFLRLKKKLPVNSSLLKLYSICGEPFQKGEGYWPSNYCHGQTFPVNIFHCSSNQDKFYFIDFEPGLIGLGPYAYDLVFFILYASDLISENAMKNISKIMFSEKKSYYWAQYFLAQIIWWSRNRKLNDSQMKKIESRSLKTLSLINKTKD